MISRILFLLFLFPVYIAAQNVKSPEDFLGFRVGADYKIASYETIQKYFRHLAENSDKLIYREIGKSTLGREMFMAIISTPDNLRKLDHYVSISKRLSDPRKLNEETAAQLSAEGKVIVLVTCNIHSTEIGSAQMSMELAHDMITGKSEKEVLNAMNDVIFFLMPSINPDGTTMVVDWYNKYLGTEFDGAPLPYLYHHYSGHDNNRDWFMFNLAETRNVIKVAFHDFLPQIWLDEHQMGSTGARLFVVPYKDPINPNVHPLLWRWQKVIGGMTTLHLEQKGMSGVIDHAYFEGWWEGPASDCGLWHNQISLLSEMASCNIASPVYLDPNEVKATTEVTTYDLRTNYPNPWRGGWWRLRDIVDYELELTYSLIKTSSHYKNEILKNYYDVGKAAIKAGEEGNPYMYIIPREQNDPVTTSKMIEILQLGAVEVHFADKEFTIDNTIYPAESYVIYLNQPYGRYVKDLMEDQFYPDLRNSRKETPIRPYDVAGWTLPYLMGVKHFTINKKYSGEFRLLTDANYPQGGVSEGTGKYVIFQAGPNANSALINRLQKNNINCYWLTKETKLKRGTGEIILKPGAVVTEKANVASVRKIAEELHLKGLMTDEINDGDLKQLKKVRVGLYKPYTANMDEGWTRLMMENYEFEFTGIVNKDFKEKKLKDKYDVIIIPDMTADLIKTGKYAGENERFNRPKPPEFSGGIEKEGVENLKKFIEEDGGFVIAIGNACNFAIEDLGLRAANALKGVKSDDHYCPGSLLAMKTDNTKPIAYGMENEFIGYQQSSISFTTSPPFGKYDRDIIVRYPDKNILKSGFLIGEEYLYRTAPVVDIKQKNGHVILFGFKPQNRHQTFGTFKLLFNAIHYAGV
ncbi:MAG: hypothetical protein HUU54_12710 [Ignavibacteriaceae bacterium]|nr:hypothetical protein [Ignavibacteriaceae bacterium]